MNSASSYAYKLWFIKRRLFREAHTSINSLTTETKIKYERNFEKYFHLYRLDSHNIQGIDNYGNIHLSLVTVRVA